MLGIHVLATLVVVGYANGLQQFDLEADVTRVLYYPGAGRNGVEAEWFGWVQDDDQSEQRRLVTLNHHHGLKEGRRILHGTFGQEGSSFLATGSRPVDEAQVPDELEEALNRDHYNGERSGDSSYDGPDGGPAPDSSMDHVRVTTGNRQLFAAQVRYKDTPGDEGFNHTAFQLIVNETVRVVHRQSYGKVRFNVTFAVIELPGSLENWTHMSPWEQVPTVYNVAREQLGADVTFQLRGTFEFVLLDWFSDNTPSNWFFGGGGQHICIMSGGGWLRSFTVYHHELLHTFGTNHQNFYGEYGDVELYPCAPFRKEYGWFDEEEVVELTPYDPVTSINVEIAAYDAYDQTDEIQPKRTDVLYMVRGWSYTEGSGNYGPITV